MARAGFAAPAFGRFFARRRLRPPRGGAGVGRAFLFPRVPGINRHRVVAESICSQDHEGLYSTVAVSAEINQNPLAARLSRRKPDGSCVLWWPDAGRVGTSLALVAGRRRGAGWWRWPDAIRGARSIDGCRRCRGWRSRICTARRRICCCLAVADPAMEAVAELLAQPAAGGGWCCTFPVRSMPPRWRRSPIRPAPQPEAAPVGSLASAARLSSRSRKRPAARHFLRHRRRPGGPRAGPAAGRRFAGR